MAGKRRKNEDGVAYITVIIIVAVVFVWAAFQLERLVQNQQTMHVDVSIIQAQYVAESGIEEMRLRLRDGSEIEPFVLSLQTGEAEVAIIHHDPLWIRSVGKVEPDIRQTVFVELSPDTLQIVSWSRRPPSLK